MNGKYKSACSQYTYMHATMIIIIMIVSLRTNGVQREHRRAKNNIYLTQIDPENLSMQIQLAWEHQTDEGKERMIVYVCVCLRE